MTHVRDFNIKITQRETDSQLSSFLEKKKNCVLNHDDNNFNLWVVHVELGTAEVTLRHNSFPLPVNIPSIPHSPLSPRASTI